jgi:phosphoglycolate phosphatase-like HAD superfamily hydrolase
VTDLLTPIFDLDGTLIDSDEALISPFVVLGIDRADVQFGQPLAHECHRLGLTVDDYLAAYDLAAAQPFPGVADLLDQIHRWSVCSNKDGRSGRAELDRLAWKPELALFTDDFGGPKRLQPVLDALAIDPATAVFIGDTEHDGRCAADAGVPFALAAWNPRARQHAELADIVLTEPADLLAVLSDGVV